MIEDIIIGYLMLFFALWIGHRQHMKRISKERKADEAREKQTA